MDRFTFINNLVLEIKIGNIQSYRKLWSIYKPLIIRIIEKFIEKYCVLAEFKDDLLLDAYTFFYNIINDYDFENQYGFSYHVKNETILRLFKISYTKYGVKTNECEDLEFISNLSTKKSIIEKELFDIYCKIIHKMTLKQSQAFYLYFVLGLDQIVVAKEIGISQVGVCNRIQLIYKKARKMIKKTNKQYLSKGVGA